MKWYCHYGSHCMPTFKSSLYFIDFFTQERESAKTYFASYIVRTSIYTVVRLAATIN